jgi:non-specific serine/threonine protein kinase
MARVAQWTFDDVLIDNDAREVRRNGIPVPLSPKAFQLLGILVSVRPKALSKQELQEHLWPDTFVVEKNLTNLISEIRETLDDDPARPRFIRTVPRFGYAFIHPPSAMPGASDAAATTGAAAAGESRRHNLPVARTSFIGRERELADLISRASRTPLLTLTGVGGCGKTRLALELGRRLMDTFDDGVWFVDLSGVFDAALIEQSVASALDLRQQPPASLLQLVSGFLRPRRALLILDNCEHLIADCARIADALLRGAPGLTILATSRESLAIDGEAVWPVPPLSLPSADDQSIDAIGECESVRLFHARAAAVDPAFRITDANRSATVDICRQLDGVPLAIELAAARLTVLSVDQIRERLADRFALLQRGSFTAPPRQRALEASVDWSYDLLAAPERLVFERLAVFPGGATIDTVEEVCAGDGVARDQVLPLLTHLVNKSLLTVDDDPTGDRRYRYLETIRHYAGRRLQESGGADRLGARHLTAHLDLARRAEPGLLGREQSFWLRRLHAEQDNLRAALEWSLSRPERAPDGLELATALVWFWIMRGAFSEGQHWLSRALSMNPAPGARVRARASTGLGDMLFFQGDLEGAGGMFEESVLHARTAGDFAAAAHALGMHALACMERNDLAAGARLAAEALEVASATQTLEARGPAASFFAYQALDQGDVDRSASLQEELLALTRASGNTWALALIMFDLSLVRVVQGRAGDASVLCAEAIALSREFADYRGMAWSFGVLAGAEAVAERPLRAATLLGVMEAMCERAGAPAQPSFKRWIFNPYFGAVQTALGPARYLEALDAGRAMSVDDAVAYAFERRTTGAAHRPASHALRT